jgi:hypothetical protein
MVVVVVVVLVVVMRGGEDVGGVDTYLSRYLFELT